MNTDQIRIIPIINPHLTNANNDMLHVCWIQNNFVDIKIEETNYSNLNNAIIFLNKSINWKIIDKKNKGSAGYIMSLSPSILNNPILSKLHINELRVFNSKEIPIINLSPGIAKRTQAIIEMIDELIGTHLNHKEDAIFSLLNTFFVYCDGQCNIKSVISHNGSKKALVYKFKKLVDKNLSEFHEVSDYAKLLSITPKYLNKCVKTVLGFTAKDLIAEQLMMQSRHKLKFSYLSIKEISYELGFSSPEYFSYFFKNLTGISPSALRKN
ncbi:helix-turn-helix domain-containing protein [Winogradskyella vincentii]|uniref:Helix-turn-helix domain-containing protein n=1 Tax=Winogradskyella vincentii TaxID=2877122 RepID=A0ABS7Y3R9_9FLAO|nr:helix-turn-helix domain-containing protein [Winogradskyella vincentii]MCA0153328.1 helix-turn-helix domain-containing protein [Winogradskyella vincentii]